MPTVAPFLVFHPRRLRRTLFVLLASYGVALLYGTLYPFRFTLDRWNRPTAFVKKIEWVPFTYVSRALRIRDAGLNVAIFVPVGAFLAALWLCRGTSKKVVGLTTAAGFNVSFAIETAQCFLPSRFPSTTDLLMNTLGTCLGAALAVALLPRESTVPQMTRITRMDRGN